MSNRSLLLLALLTACAPSTATDSMGVDSTSDDHRASTGSSGRETEAEGSSSSSGGSSGTLGETLSGSFTGSETSTGEVVTTTGDSIGDSIGGTGSTGGMEPLCWAKTCDADHPCAPGLTCELHPDAVGLWVCSTTCEACDTGLFFCDAAVPVGECIAGPNEMRCFPVLCPNGPTDCKGGQECINGACFNN